MIVLDRELKKNQSSGKEFKAVTFDSNLSSSIQPETDPQPGAESDPGSKSVAKLSKRALYGTAAVVAVLLGLLLRDS